MGLPVPAQQARVPDDLHCSLDAGGAAVVWDALAARWGACRLDMESQRLELKSSDLNGKPLPVTAGELAKRINKAAFAAQTAGYEKWKLEPHKLAGPERLATRLDSGAPAVRRLGGRARLDVAPLQEWQPLAVSASLLRCQQVASSPLCGCAQVEAYPVSQRWAVPSAALGSS